MKRINYSVILLALMGLVACGQSEGDKAATGNATT